MFTEILRDGHQFDPIEVQIHPEDNAVYRILDGAHRWNAHKEIGAAEIPAVIAPLEGTDPLLYAAQKAIGPLQLTEGEARDTARRAYRNNSRLTSVEIGRAIGRSRQAVGRYIADLRAAADLELDLKILRMNRNNMPQDRIAKRLGIGQKVVSSHLDKMLTWADSLNSDLEKGFTVPQVAEKYSWPEPLVWSVVLEGKDDLQRFRELNWGLQSWDVWNFNDCDRRFGDEWPGRIPAQLVGHILYFFSNQNDLVFDPTAGGGVVADTCLALNRNCWSFDMDDRPGTRPEIEPHFWDPENPAWPVFGKAKPDLIIFDPPYFSKKVDDYGPKSIAGLSKDAYLNFFRRFFKLAHQNTKRNTRLALITADWRDFQNTPAIKEHWERSVVNHDYIMALFESGWQFTHVLQAPMSSQRIKPNVVAAMQKKRIIGVTSRYVFIAQK